MDPIYTAAVHGTRARPLTVTAAEDRTRILAGPPSIHSDLSEPATRELRQRVHHALENSDRLAPTRPYGVAIGGETASAAPVDLAAAVAILAADHDWPATRTASACFYGELALSGAVRPVRGSLAVAEMCVREGIRRLFVSTDSAPLCAHVEGVTVYPVDNLAQMPPMLAEIEAVTPWTPSEWTPKETVCFSDIRGLSPETLRAIEIAATGRHSLLMIGTPGSGKTMVARRIAGILPTLTHAEAMESTVIHDAAGLMQGMEAPIFARPFRAPHHTVSLAGLRGGGKPTRPGEMSLAHNGVLFLDEAPEFDREAIEWATRPRTYPEIQMPTDYLLIGAANPCPCGRYDGAADHTCRCIPLQRHRYLDRTRARFDLAFTLPTVLYLTHGPTGPTTAEIRDRVTAARARRAGIEPLYGLTSALDHVARTIAALDGTPAITGAHVSEAARLITPRAKEIHQ